MERANVIGFINMLWNKRTYLKILDPIIEGYRRKNYSFWESHIGDQITFEGKTDDGIEYQVEIEPFYDDKKKKTIRVVFAIDDGWLRAYFPVCSDFIMAPDGSFVGE